MSSTTMFLALLSSATRAHRMARSSADRDWVVGRASRVVVSKGPPGSRKFAGNPGMPMKHEEGQLECRCGSRSPPRLLYHFTFAFGAGVKETPAIRSRGSSGVVSGKNL